MEQNDHSAGQSGQPAQWRPPSHTNAPDTIRKNHCKNEHKGHHHERLEETRAIPKQTNTISMAINDLSQLDVAVSARILVL
jgi:hypothetical protein